MKSPLISVIVLTYNEEVNLQACLESLKGLDCEVCIVDSGSSDRTVEMAREFGVQIVCHEFKTQAQQLNWALDNLSMRGDWVLRLDADERLTPKLSQELCTVLPLLQPHITGCYLKRRVYFLGRWMRHGGYYPTWLLRVWREGCARSEDRLMDEHMVLHHGQAGFLHHDIVEQNQKDLLAWTERQNRYSSREAAALLKGSVDDQILPQLFGTPEARRRWLKQNVYLRFPPLLRALLYFGYRYVFQRGFLDGKEGLIFHFLHGCWYRFLIDAKLYEGRLQGGHDRMSELPSPGESLLKESAPAQE